MARAANDSFLLIEREVERLAPEPLTTINANEVAALFGRSVWWMRHSEVRRQLDSQGFPPPISLNRWLKRAVVRFIVARSHGISFAAHVRARPANDVGDAGDDAARLRALRSAPKGKARRAGARRGA